MTGRKTRRRSSGADQGAHWISYSDMMASLLMVFVLAVVYSVYQYYQMLDIKTKELEQQQDQLNQATLILVQREEEVEQLNLELVGEREKLALVQIQLDEQEKDLHAAQDALKTKEEEQAALQLQLNEQQTVIDEQRLELQAQQQRLDELVGVRTQIIHDLSDAFAQANLRVTVDETTGDIILDSTVFFDVNSNNIKASGQELLNRFVPIYLSVLMRPEYRDFVGEIVIVGHTDTAGSYISNLKLSQNRALSVAEFCLQMPGLTPEERLLLQELLTAQGRSYSDPVYNADGSVNMEASRRVEFKFRLKDDEMIAEMNRILSDFE